MPHQEVQQDPQSVAQEAAANVVSIFDRRPAANRAPPVTAEEIAEFRRVWPDVLKMLDEWKEVTAAKDGCPVARQILCGRK